MNIDVNINIHTDEYVNIYIILIRQRGPMQTIKIDVIIIAFGNDYYGLILVLFYSKNNIGHSLNILLLLIR